MAAVEGIAREPCEVRQKIRAVPLRESSNTLCWRKLCSGCCSASSVHLWSRRRSLYALLSPPSAGTQVRWRGRWLTWAPTITSASLRTSARALTRWPRSPSNTASGWRAPGRKLVQEPLRHIYRIANFSECLHLKPINLHKIKPFFQKEKLQANTLS